MLELVPMLMDALLELLNVDQAAREESKIQTDPKIG